MSVPTGQFGPFSVSAGQVAGLSGGLFQELVSRLLDKEAARAGMTGADLHTSYHENVGDGGVDAATYNSSGNEWIPAGDCAFQFKAGDLTPAQCAAELKSATRAREILDQGGRYRLVLGKGLEDKLIARREAKLREAAQDLGYDVSNDRFRVLDGNQLARWIERYPQLAISQVLRGSGSIAIDFASWALSKPHQYEWVSSDSREVLKLTVLNFVSRPDEHQLRIEGGSGLGKTRGVFEALRGSSYEGLVIYVGDGEQLMAPLISHLSSQSRTAIIVVDECSRHRHHVLTQAIEQDTSIKLITIGQRDAQLPDVPPLALAALPEDTLDEILSKNVPALWPEARPVIVANSVGNVGFAFYLAQAVIKNPGIGIGELITRDTLQGLISESLSEDDNFLALSALALFGRYGVDRERANELSVIAEGLGLPLEQLMQANRSLERLGLLNRQGRYRAVTPQPLAAYLARHAWAEFGEKIVVDLLPNLGPSLSEQLFLRAADLGATGPAATALHEILGSEGPFNSLQTMQWAGTSPLLVQLAIIAPDALVSHLATLIDETPDGELAELTSIRRDLVRALERLVWHSRTFEVAASALLRLALTENETWANNATGTWVGLFGAMLPTTAASPAARIAYLTGCRGATDPAVRKLVAEAAAHASDISGGLVMVSGELQGGVIVQPRGRPETYADLYAYLEAAIDLLAALSVDEDATVAESALKALISAIHPYLDFEPVRQHLFDALASLPADPLNRVRTELKHLEALFSNVEKPAFREATNSEPDVTDRRDGLVLLLSRLPAPSTVDEIRSLAHAHRWEWEGGELQAALLSRVKMLEASEAANLIYELLSESKAPDASFELGVALQAVSGGDAAVTALTEIASNGNIAGLVGYLNASMESGVTDSFDAYLDCLGQNLDAATRLAITVRGPQSDAGWARFLAIIEELPVSVAVPRMFGWHIDVQSAYLEVILETLLRNIKSQQDYNFAVDAVAMMVYQQDELPTAIAERVQDVVQMRSKFPDVGQESWDWSQLARKRLASDPTGLLSDLLDYIESNSIRILDGTQERGLLTEAIKATQITSLDQVLSRVQGGSWRSQMAFRGWLASLYLASDVTAWVNTDTQRARFIASMIPIGTGEVSELMQYLLDRFGDDDEVKSSLIGEFISGSWTGKYSARLTRQIEQLDSWIANATYSVGVKKWARVVRADLIKQRKTELEREEERGY